MLVAIDVITYALVAWAAITQLIIPLCNGSRLFPAFSKKSLELVDEIKQIDQEIAAEHLRRELELKQAQLKQEKETHGS